MSTDQIAHVNIVAYTGAVFGRKSFENIEMRQALRRHQENALIR